MSTPAESFEIIRKHLSMLSEHFDTVQIIATRLEPSGGTRPFYLGTGNYYARIGSAQEWLARDAAETNAQELGKQINRPDES